MLNITIMGKGGEVLLKGNFPSIGAAFDHAAANGIDLQGDTFIGRCSEKNGVDVVELLSIEEEGTTKEVTERKCCYCGKAQDLRPYGPDFAPICFDCMKESPEREEEASKNLGAFFELAESMGKSRQ